MSLEELKRDVPLSSAKELLDYVYVHTYHTRDFMFAIKAYPLFGGDIVIVRSYPTRDPMAHYVHALSDALLDMSRRMDIQKGYDLVDVVEEPEFIQAIYRRQKL